MTTWEHYFVVYRVDHWADGSRDHRNVFTIKEVVRSAEEAQREVARLNALNAAKSCEYFYQCAKYYPDGR